jgi:hypothetical protein
MTKGFYLISGVKIEIVSPQPSNDVRFMTQRALFALGTAEAMAELQRRAEIIKKRNAEQAPA